MVVMSIRIFVRVLYALLLLTLLPTVIALVH